MKILTVLPWIAVALAAQTPTIEQSLNLKAATSPRISPDGRFIAYLVSETNWEENAFDTQIWMAMTATGERYQLTHAKKSSSDPRWAPDSKRLAFRSNRDGSQQIYVISPAGGEATQLTHFEGGVESFQWSPDGHRIAFTSAGAEPKAKKDRKEKYGDFEIVEGDYTMVHIWVLNVDDDKPNPEALTTGGQFSVGAFNWSPDGKHIAFSATRDPAVSSSGSADLYVVRLSDKYVKRLVDTAGPDRNPVWSPDGSEIAYETANGRDDSYLNSHVAIVPAEGGKPRLLGESFDAPDEIEFRLWAGVPIAKATLRRLFRPSFFQGGASFREPMDFQCHLDAHEYTKTVSNCYASPCPRESEPLKYSFAIREMFDKHYS